MDITEEAKQELRRIIGKYDLGKDKRFRLATPPVWEGEGDFGIVIDVERERDQVIENSSDLTQKLRNIFQNRRWTLRNPVSPWMYIN